jgi:hypothetical protein
MITYEQVVKWIVNQILMTITDVEDLESSVEVFMEDLTATVRKQAADKAAEITARHTETLGPR